MSIAFRRRRVLFAQAMGGRIPRAEVEEMGRVVMRELEDFEAGCASTIVGGYVHRAPSILET